MRSTGRLYAVSWKRMRLLATVTIIVMGAASLWVLPRISRRSRLVMTIEPVEERPTTRAQILENAKGWLGVPYQLGGNSIEGIDCSTFVSAVAWGNKYFTTDLMYRICHPIQKSELLPGDALNIPEPGEKGHIYLFDHWADESQDSVWVYDASASCGGVCYRQVAYDGKWVPIRYNWIDD